ncbi:MAG TPA: hypothetical protein VNE67_01555, partial [Acetobacteraceae bacterium]|nr:hypothetical protein [Acetobacteraceae bacterium]
MGAILRAFPPEHPSMPWNLVPDPEIAPDDLVHACLTDGRIRVEILGYIRIAARTAWIEDLHIQGPGPRQLGIGRLRDLARWAMEALDVDELCIEGAARTSGAGPGRCPAALVFRRPRRAGVAPERAF